ncbi:hypothetical protein [Rugosimonospora acidiphila]
MAAAGCGMLPVTGARTTLWIAAAIALIVLGLLLTRLTSVRASRR